MDRILQTIPWARRLKIRHLEVFVVLDETRSLTETARRLHMSQSAVSQWLSGAETAVGRALFLRDRRLTLTADGEVVLAHARRVLGDVQRTHAELEAVSQGLEGRLNVGTGLPRVLLPRAIARLHQERPRIFVSIMEAPLPVLLASLARCEVDVIIGSLSAQAMQSGFACEALLSDSIQVVARLGHPLLERPEVEWEETLAFPWILPPRNSVMRVSLDEAFARKGLVPPEACIEGTSSMRIQLLLGEREYVSILAASEAKLYGPIERVGQVCLSSEIPFPNIGIIWSTDRAASLLIGLLDALRYEARTALESQKSP